MGLETVPTKLGKWLQEAFFSLEATWGSAGCTQLALAQGLRRAGGMDGECLLGGEHRERLQSHTQVLLVSVFLCPKLPVPPPGNGEVSLCPCSRQPCSGMDQASGKGRCCIHSFFSPKMRYNKAVPTGWKDHYLGYTESGGNSKDSASTHFCPGQSVVRKDVEGRLETPQGGQSCRGGQQGCGTAEQGQEPLGSQPEAAPPSGGQFLRG